MGTRKNRKYIERMEMVSELIRSEFIFSTQTVLTRESYSVSLFCPAAGLEPP
jgi:hypothetical protein